MNPTFSTKKLVVGITGASGAIYAYRFLCEAIRHYERIYVILSEQARQIMAVEMDLHFSNAQEFAALFPKASAKVLQLLSPKEYFSPPASGSFRHDGMVIVPCSMGTAARIAHGISDDLLTRAADVCLKERRKLVLVPRETPWSLIHLRTFTQLAEAGAVVLPAAPGFYHHPKTVEELADFVVARILQQLGIDQDIVPQWQLVEE